MLSPRRSLAFAAFALLSFGLGCSDKSGSGTGGAGAGGTTVSIASPASNSANASTTGAGGSGGSAPTCNADDGWVTFGHDAQRTFATAACIHGPLTTAWHYTPTPPADQVPIDGIFSAIATKDAAYLKWKGKQGPYFGTPFVDAIGPTGANIWQYNSGVDSSFGQPLSIAFGKIVTNDDGLSFLDAVTGMATFNAGVDFWGSTAPVPERVYVVNTAKVDGPGVFVGAYDQAGTQLWKQNEMSGSGQFSHQDSVGALAEDGGVLFFAASYMTNAPPLMFQSGVYSFDGASGTPGWYQATTPVGGISAGGGKIYGTETANGMASLVARNQSDGTVAWSQIPDGGVGGQPPVLAMGLVIVGTSTSVIAYHAQDGAPAWTAAVPGAGSPSFATPPRTTMLAALASQTLFVIAGNGYVLNLSDGSIAWTGMLDGVAGGGEPIAVGDRIYVVDGTALTALQSAP